MKQWETKQSIHHDGQQVHHVKNLVGYVLFEHTHAQTVYTSKDFTLVNRNGTFEIWTNRPFKEAEIVLVPDTTEIEDKYWKFGNHTALAENGDKLHPDRRHIVLSGRLRNAPVDHRPFALFWIAKRLTINDDQKLANLTMDYTVTEVDMTIRMPFDGLRMVKIARTATMLPQIPVLYNPSKLAKGQQLIVGHDMGLAKAHEKQKARQAKDKEKADKDKAGETGDKPGPISAPTHDDGAPAVGSVGTPAANKAAPAVGKPAATKAKNKIIKKPTK